MTSFYIVRHGNTEFNQRGRIQGGQIDSPLTEQGYQDAIFLSKKLHGIKFESVVSSDLGRTFITAHIIADNLGLSKRILRSKGLREIDFGDLTAKLREDAGYQKIKRDSSLRAPRGESYADLQKRVIKILLDLSRRNYKNVLVVTHAGCIRCILSEALGKSLDSLLERKVSHRFIARLDIEGRRFRGFKIINE